MGIDLKEFNELECRCHNIILNPFSCQAQSVYRCVRNVKRNQTTLSQLVQQARKIFRQRGGKHESFSGASIIDSQFFSMQSLARKTSNTKLRIYDGGGKLRSFAIYWITDQGKSQVRQMNPQLMGSAGAGRESQESEPTQRIGGISESKTLFHPPLRDRLAFLAKG